MAPITLIVANAALSAYKGVALQPLIDSRKAELEAAGHKVVIVNDLSKLKSTRAELKAAGAGGFDQPQANGNTDSLPQHCLTFPGASVAADGSMSLTVDINLFQLFLKLNPAAAPQCLHDDGSMKHVHMKVDIQQGNMFVGAETRDAIRNYVTTFMALPKASYKGARFQLREVKGGFHMMPVLVPTGFLLLTFDPETFEVVEDVDGNGKDMMSCTFSEVAIVGDLSFERTTQASQSIKAVDQNSNPAWAAAFAAVTNTVTPTPNTGRPASSTGMSLTL